jgi:hypothetical protein
MQLPAAYYTCIVFTMLNVNKMKLNCWIGPLIAVIILLTLRQMVYDAKENDQQRSVIPAAIEKQNPEINPPMAGTLIKRDTLPF